MALKPPEEITIAVAVSAMAYASYQFFLPSVADVRSLEPGNKDIQSAERTATVLAAGFVGLVSLIAKSPSVFMLGGGTVIAAAWSHRHADQVSAVSKKASSMVPQPATGTEGVVGDDVAGSQQLASTPMYGVAV